MEIMNQILNSITWVHLLFVFALVFVLVFRNPLSDLIRRITKIDKEGLTARPTPETQREKNETSAEAVQMLLDVVGNSIVINELEDSIRKDLEDKGLSSDGDSEKVLIKHLAGTQLLLAFERIHGPIFGSQIYLLKKLNEVTGQGRDRKFIENHIQDVKELYENQLEDWSSDQYLQFLFSHSLIIRHIDQFHITNLGVEYLTWIARNGKREDKPL